MADTLLFRGGPTVNISASTVSDREIVIDTDTDEIVVGSAKKRTIMNGNDITIDSSGKLSVGNVSGNVTSSDLEVTPTNGNASVVIGRLSSTSNDNTSFRVQDRVGNTILSASPSNPLTVGRSGNEYARIDSSGNVKIGGTLPSAPNIELNSSGSASFAGDIDIAGGNTGSSTGSAGATFSANGLLSVRRSDSASSIFAGYAVNGTSPVVNLKADGSASFDGIGTFGSYDSSSASGTGVQVNSGGVLRVQRTSTAGTAQVFQGYLGNTPTSEIFADGSVTCTADATINGLTVGRGAGNVNGNSAFGYLALNSNTTGYNNVANGYLSLNLNTTGNNNVATGLRALYSNTTGNDNVASGYEALRNNTTGYSNTAIGRESLKNNTTGNNNTANGYEALYNNTTGSNNVANGYEALKKNTTGNYNVANGRNALNFNTTGSNNVANGYAALLTNTTGSENVATGRNALNLNTTGSYNVANGNYSLYYNTTGIHNTANGSYALYSSTTGSYNVANGYKALINNTTGSSNTANGYEALYYNTTGEYNVANGFAALYSNTTGNYNVATGVNALYLNTTGVNNVANGYTALNFNTTGSYNTANGYAALQKNTTANSNTANGFEALYSNTTGTDNVAIGVIALQNNTTGSSNTANGRNALRYNTTGIDNTANGVSSLYSNTTGSYNVANGRSALYNNTTGSGNIGIGFVNNSGTYVPVFDPSTHNNRLVLGHTAITNAYVKVAWTVTSDERDKMNFAPVPYGLDFVNQLKPTAFQFKVDRDTEEPNGDVRYGFKAQDILALEGDNPVIIDTEDADHLKYKGEHLVPVLVNAVQELTTMVKELQDEIKTLKG